jgi:hypothetical protein
MDMRDRRTRLGCFQRTGGDLLRRNRQIRRLFGTRQVSRDRAGDEGLLLGSRHRTYSSPEEVTGSRLAQAGIAGERLVRGRQPHTIAMQS